MKSKKGQALLEFVLILPIMLMLLLGIIDYGRILYEKNKLENITSDIVDMLDNHVSETYILNKVNTTYGDNIGVKLSSKTNQVTITVSEALNIYTPGLSNILHNPYDIEVSRVIYNE